MREWQEPLTPEKIAWLEEKFKQLVERRPALGLPWGEYWDYPYA